ncbi:MAG: 50S ribosomal protein L6 [Clostridia bacterium]|jgi:large subunit ribosomal protein L6|nr:50S ribosomal protein L6 [Clostridia bacterium]
MSRIGKMPITIPAGVKVDITADNVITVKGAKETLTRTLHPDMKVVVEGDTITVTRPSDNKTHRSLHGLTRTLINNMVIGVTDGFTKTLEINGVGYRAAMKGKVLDLTLGYSHPVNYEAEAGITIEVPQPNQIIVKGADKERVGAVAAKIRSFRAPEPYKGKGIKYADEYIRRKEGKTGAKKK